MSGQHLPKHHVSAALERRYPGVRCEVTKWVGDPDSSWWNICFSAADMETLVGHGLATAAQFEDRAIGIPDGFGNSYGATHWSWAGPTHPHCETPYSVDWTVGEHGFGKMRFTKKLQKQVERMLKPFVRGTWKPPLAA